MSTASAGLTKGRIWYLLGGGISAVIGLLAILRPGLASVAIEQFLGAFFILSGVVLLASALLGKARQHRLLDLFSSGLRLIVGVLLIVKALNGLMALTVVMASLFFAEGIFGTVFAFRYRGKNPAWIWILLNGLVAFLLGGMLLAEFPSDAPWALGLLFGINSLFLGASLILFALAMGRGREE